MGVAPSCGPPAAAGLPRRCPAADKVTVATRAAAAAVDTVSTRDLCNNVRYCQNLSIEKKERRMFPLLQYACILIMLFLTFNVAVHPMKLITTRCNTRLAMRKSPKALSGLMLMNWDLFCGLDCIRRQTTRNNDNMIRCAPIRIILYKIPPSTNDPTQDMNPDRKELKGKVPTRRQ